MKKKLTLILCSLLIVLFSCKNGDKNNKQKNSNIPKETKINTKPIAKEYLYKAKINSKSGLFLLEENNTDSEKIIKIPFNTTIGIIAFTDKFETLKSNKKYDYYGKWVEIEYLQENGDYISGFVFDDFLDYQFNKKDISNNTSKDTVTITNVNEFVNALSSNRVIWIDTDLLNLEKYIKENNIDESLIVDPSSEDEIYFENETYLVSGYFSSFGLYDFHNLEIRGKDKMVNIVVNDHDTHILDFYNCNNIFIDNINFYHEGDFIGACGGEVVTFTNCTNFNIQNSHFDGSGSVGSVINNCDNFNFLNCEFYKNTENAIIINSSTKTTINRSDFHNNNLGDLFYIDHSTSKDTSINLIDAYIKENTTFDNVFAIKNNTSEGAEEGKLSLYIKNCIIENNLVGTNILEYSQTENINISVINSKIINNTSNDNDCIIKTSNYDNVQINFENTIISDNIDFYAFSNEEKNNINQQNLIEKNIFNTASDSILTKFNTYKKDSTVMCFRNFNDLTYTEETKQLSRKKHLLEGMHRIKMPSSKNTFFKFPVDFSSTFVGEGNFINGKPDDLWEIKLENGKRNKYFITFSNGLLEGISKHLVLINESDDSKNYDYKYTSVVNGKYKQGKKHGVWQFFFKNGKLQKEITYDNGEIITPVLFYFPNGILREKTTDLKNLNGNSICYYPNGEIESNITYKDGRINISKSTFFDINGKKKKAIEVESYWLKDETGKIHSFEDVRLPKYKNSVHIHYSKKNKNLLGYVYYSDGKPYSTSKNIINRDNFKYKKLPLKTDKTDYEVTYYNTYNQTQKNSSFIYDNQKKLKYVSFINKDSLISNYKYGGSYNLIIKYNQYKIKDTKVIQHGISNNYSNYGLLLNSSSKYYRDGVIQKKY